MRLTLKPNQDIKNIPQGYVEIVLTKDDRGKGRLVREGEREILEVGAGKEGEITPRRFRLLCRAIVAAAKSNKVRKIAIQFDKTPKLFGGMRALAPEDISRDAAVNFHLADFEFTAYKERPKEGFPSIDEILLYGKSDAYVAKALKEGEAIAEEMNKCRELCNTPGGDMTPETLAQAAGRAARGTKVKVRVLGVREMKKIGMGGILGVGRGSKSEPRFIIMEYHGRGRMRSTRRHTRKDDRPIVLVGKGITFDTGGLNLKPEQGIYEMHLDMSGGAAVIHAVVAAAKLKIKRNVVGLVPAAENMPSGESYRPGDILKTLSGKTVEVLNTDAEGRIVLADGITYAGRFKPALLVDVATLTGASLIALGQQASAILSRDDDLIKRAREWGENSGDYVWPLPLWEEYEDMIKGNFADMANIPASGNSRYAGVIGGAMFLWQFAKDLKCPFLHIDMAPRMTAAPNEFLAKGSTGSPVRLLLEIIRNF